MDLPPIFLTGIVYTKVVVLRLHEPHKMRHIPSFTLCSNSFYKFRNVCSLNVLLDCMIKSSRHEVLTTF